MVVVTGSSFAFTFGHVNNFCAIIGAGAVDLHRFLMDQSDARKSKNWKELAINLTLLLGTLIGFFVIAELSVRFFAPQYIKTFQFDPVVGITRIPNSQFTYVRAEDHARINHQVNSDGFIDAEYKIPKPADTFRIIMLGDSYTEAIQMADSQRFSQLLEQQLNLLKTKKFEVINLGYSGYGTAQEYLALQKFGLKYQPDLVVLNFYADNDVSDNSARIDYSSSKPFFVVKNGVLVEDHQPTFLVNNPLLSFVTEHFALPRFLFEKIQLLKQRWSGSMSQSASVSDTVYSSVYPSSWNDAWDVTKRIISRINDEAVKTNARFAMVSIPSQGQAITDLSQALVDAAHTANQSIDLNKSDQILTSISEEQKIPLLTLRSDFASRPNVKDLYLSRDGHFSVLGNEATADAIFRFLLNGHLVPQ